MAMHLLAYIDPGSSSLIFQTVVAGGLALLIVVKSARMWIADQFRRGLRAVRRRPPAVDGTRADQGEGAAGREE